MRSTQGLWLGTLVALVAGCVPAPSPLVSAGIGVAQAGTSAFLQGELQTAIRRPFEEVLAASREAVGERGLRFKPETDRASLGSATIGVREVPAADGTGEDRLIEIEIERSSEIVTIVRVRVGFMGDQTMSRLVMDEIVDKLGLARDAVPSPRPATTISPAPVPPL